MGTSPIRLRRSIVELTPNLLFLHALARLLGPLWNLADHQRTTLEHNTLSAADGTANGIAVRGAAEVPVLLSQSKPFIQSEN